jgi:heme-degrading monooxygenase HmoA
MYLVRDTFTCKPGMSRKLSEMFKATVDAMKGIEGVKDSKVMVDTVASFWTVVVETETESLEQFERNMATFASRPEIRKHMEGYMELVQGGKREIFRIL